MKRIGAAVVSARMVFNGIPTGIHEPTEILELIGMYKSKYVASRIYKYEIEKVDNEAIEAFEKRFRNVISDNKKLRKEIRRYRELGCHPSLQLEVSVGGFDSRVGTLVDSWTFFDKIAVLARADRSIAFSFINEVEGKEVCFAISADFVKYLAKCQFAFRLIIGSCGSMSQEHYLS